MLKSLVCCRVEYMHNYDITHNANIIVPQASTIRCIKLLFIDFYHVDRFLHWVSLLDHVVCLYVTHDHEENTLNLRTIHIIE